MFIVCYELRMCNLRGKPSPILPNINIILNNTLLQYVHVMLSQAPVMTSISAKIINLMKEEGFKRQYN